MLHFRVPLLPFLATLVCVVFFEEILESIVSLSSDSGESRAPRRVGVVDDKGDDESRPGSLSTSLSEAAKRRETFQRAVRYIASTQCRGETKETIVIGHGGGFGSMFQSVAKDFFRAKLNAHQRHASVRVVFTGDYKWYTDNLRCNRTGHGCFFLSNPECGAVRVEEPPTPFERNVFWWNVCPAYLFRPNKRLLAAAESSRRTFRFEGFPDIAMHIRLGDKPASMMLTEQMSAQITPEMYLKLAEKWIYDGSVRSRFTGAKVVVYVTSDEEDAYQRVESWAQRNNNTVHLIMPKSKLFNKVGVASSSAPEAADAGGSLSQEDRFLESQEFVLDLYFMTRAKYFAGLCMSQAARMVVNIGLARGGDHGMREAVAMDEWNIEKVDDMKYGALEGWSTLSDVMNVSASASARLFKWVSLSDGRHACLPAIDESFSDVAGATFKSGSGVSERECEWFNTIKDAGIRASKEISRCVPDGTVFATLVNSHFWDILTFDLQNVETEPCFMNRLLILTMDESARLQCVTKQYKHCIPYVTSMDPSDFEQTGSSDYNPITWLKSKMALALIHSNLTVFTFDSDVLLFRVPDVDAIISTNRDADKFYQLEKVDYPALYSNTSTGENDPNVEHDGFNSGQVLWRPSEMLKLAIPKSFRLGGGLGGVESLDQGNIRKAIADADGWGATQPLSYMYASNYKGKYCVEEHSANWITYHATWVVGHDAKMIVLRKAQDSWQALRHKRTEDQGFSVYYASFGGESNCEFCLQKARWIAEYVNATTLFVPTCYGTFHTDGLAVQLLDFYNATSVGHCCDDFGNKFDILPWDPENRTGDLRVDPLPCVELLEGSCDWELGLFGKKSKVHIDYERSE